MSGLTMHYREAGVPGPTAVLLLHGFPASSHSFRDVLPRLGEQVYVVAPDLPGFGFTDAPPLDEYDYSFEKQSLAVEGLVEELGIERYFLYVTDFGTPVGYRLAMRHPERVLGIVVQNGNVHEEGLGPGWEPSRRYWADPTDEHKAELPQWFDFAGTRDQYLGGLPRSLEDLHPREAWHLDWERLSRPGLEDIQFQLFFDYRNHVASFPDIAEYHDQHQPPCLVVWGRHDPFFEIDEVMAYHRRMATLDAHLFDGGHFLLETHASEVSDLMAGFVGDVLDEAGAVR
ncbi:alpha/beta hydrolase [Actinomycetes bacterium KLBMP 9759]